MLLTGSGVLLSCREERIPWGKLRAGLQSRRRLEAARPRVFGAGGEQRLLLAPGARLRAGRARKGSGDETHSWGAAQGHTRSSGKAGSWAAPLPKLGTALGVGAHEAPKLSDQGNKKALSGWVGSLGGCCPLCPVEQRLAGPCHSPGHPDVQHPPANLQKWEFNKNLLARTV